MENLTYQLIDSGNGKKLERFGKYVIERPASQAAWQTQKPLAQWKRAHARFTREENKKWANIEALPAKWTIKVSDIIFQLSPTDFGHLGIFPEQKHFWRWAQDAITQENAKRDQPINVLNLFAYSGGSTLAAARAGAQVVHLDASKGMVTWARENAALNDLGEAPIRWITDDVNKFIKRELKRGNRYDAIILDPPTFGRGAKGELFKIEEEIVPLLQTCRELLTESPLFIMLSCHTPGYTPTVLHHLLEQSVEGLGGSISKGEMFLEGEGFPLPSGAFARWYIHG